MADRFYELSIAASYGGGKATVTHHLHDDTEAGATAIAGLWAGGPATAYHSILPPEWTLIDLQVLELADPVLGYLPAAYVFPYGDPGTRSHDSDVLASWLCCRATLYSGFRGRRHRGANCFPGGVESDLYGQTLTTDAGSWVSEVNGYLDAMQSAFSGVDAPAWGVWSKKQVKSTGWTTEAFSPIVGWIVHDQVRGLRRRRVAG